jgi:hypothetical protein
MATTTPNFGWTVPTSSDLVKNGATAIETLGDSIDASLVDLKGGTTGQVLKKATNTDMDFVWSADSAGMTNPMTTTGDTIYSSSGSTPARLGIGSTGQVLTVAAGIPSWATPSGSSPNYQLLNSGGTTLTGDTTITISGISGKNSLLVYVTGASSANSGAVFTLRMNADSANYVQLGGAAYSDSSNFFTPDDGATNGVNLGRIGGNSAANTCKAFVKIDGANAAGLKVFSSNGNVTGTSDARSYAMQGYYSGTSAVSSISIVSSSGNFDAGTIYVYGA